MEYLGNSGFYATTRAKQTIFVGFGMNLVAIESFLASIKTMANFALKILMKSILPFFLHHHYSLHHHFCIT